MKKALGLCGWCALLAMPALVARADNAPAVTTAKPAAPSVPPPAVTQALQTPTTPLPVEVTPIDGMEFSTSEDPEVIAERTMELQDEAKRNARSVPQQQLTQEAAARANDSDWMLRGYEEQLKKSGLAQPADPNSTPDAQLSDASITTATDTDPLFNPPDQDARARSLARQHDQTPETAPAKPSSISSLTSLQPLLPPLNSPSLKTPRNAFGSTPAPVVDANFDPNMIPPPVVTNDNNATSSSLDIPGLTASQNGIGAPRDLGFQDALPDDSSDRHTKKLADRNNFMVPVAPTSDVTEFFKKQAEALQPPTVPSVMPTLPLPAKVPLPYAQRPMAKPAISGLRTHIDDPFDYLNR